MLVIDYDRLNGLQRDIHDVSNAFEQLFTCIFAASLLDVELEVLNCPFASVVLVVTITILLNGDVCQVDHHVVHFSHVARVFFGAESREASSVQIGSQRFVARDQNVHAQIEFLTTDEQGLLDVPGDDVGL